MKMLEEAYRQLQAGALQFLEPVENPPTTKTEDTKKNRTVPRRARHGVHELISRFRQAATTAFLAAAPAAASPTSLRRTASARVAASTARKSTGTHIKADEAGAGRHANSAARRGGEPVTRPGSGGTGGQKAAAVVAAVVVVEAVEELIAASMQRGQAEMAAVLLADLDCVELPVLRAAPAADDDTTARVSRVPCDANLPLMLRTTRCLWTHDIYTHVVAFYTTLNGDPYGDGGVALLATLLEQYVEATVQLLLRYLRVPPLPHVASARKSATRGEKEKTSQHTSVAEACYHIIFSGTVHVYEMVQMVLRRVGLLREGSRPAQCSLRRRCIHVIATCIAICEGGEVASGAPPTFANLATVKYLPWRLQLYELLAQCYEVLELHAEALLVAQRAKHKTIELVELEMLDTLPATPAAQQEMRVAMQRSGLMQWKYMLYNSASRAAAASGAPSSTPPGQEGSSTSVFALPQSGEAMLQALYEDVYASTEAFADLSASTAAAGRANEGQQDLAARQVKDQADSYVQHHALPPLLGMCCVPPAATAEVSEDASLRSADALAPLRPRALEALVILMQLAVQQYGEACRYAGTTLKAAAFYPAGYAIKDDITADAEAAAADSAAVLPGQPSGSGGAAAEAARAPKSARQKSARGRAGMGSAGGRVAQAASSSVGSPRRHLPSAPTTTMSLLFPALCGGGNGSPSATDEVVVAGQLPIEDPVRTELVRLLLLHQLLLHAAPEDLFVQICAMSLHLLGSIAGSTRAAGDFASSAASVAHPGSATRSLPRELQRVAATIRLLQVLRYSRVIASPGVSDAASASQLEQQQQQQQQPADHVVAKDPEPLAVSSLLPAAEALRTVCAALPGPASTRCYPTGPLLAASSANQSAAVASAYEHVLHEAAVAVAQAAAVALHRSSATRVAHSELGLMPPSSSSVSTLIAAKNAAHAEDGALREAYCQIVMCVVNALRLSGCAAATQVAALALQLVQPMMQEADCEATTVAPGEDALDVQERQWRRLLGALQAALGGVVGRQEALLLAARVAQPASAAQPVQIATRIRDLQDHRTALTRGVVELRWRLALVRSQRAAVAEHEGKISLLRRRQANERVYGITTAKETRVLHNLTTSGPALPQHVMEEEDHILSAASHDPLRRAITAITLARMPKPLSLQRAQLTLAMALLEKHNVRTRDGDAPAALQQPPEAELYSLPLMWCYMASAGAQLGLLTQAEAAIAVLLQRFANDDAGGDMSGAALTTAAAVDTTARQPTLTELMQRLHLRPNAHALAKSSYLLRSALSDALIGLTQAQMKAVQRAADPSGTRQAPQATVDHAVLLRSLQCTQRATMALQVVLSMNDLTSRHGVDAGGTAVAACAQTLRCAVALFNAVLPCVQEPFTYPYIMEPLCHLARTLRRVEGVSWGAADLQLLGVRVASAMHRVLQRLQKDANLASQPMTTNHEDGEALDLMGGEVAAASAAHAMRQFEHLFYQLFAHVWNGSYRHPNQRQRLHIKAVLAASDQARRVLSVVTADGTRLWCAVPPPPSTLTVAAEASEKPNERRRAAARPGRSAARQANAPEAELSDAASPDGPPGSAYITSADAPLLADQQPVELLALLEDVLFSDPVAAVQALLPQRTATAAGERSTSGGGGTTPAATATYAATEAGLHLVGIPASLAAVIAALARTDGSASSAVLEALQRHREEPCHAQLSLCVARRLLQQQATEAAHSVITAALIVAAESWTAMQQHTIDRFRRLDAWLAANGFTVTAQDAARAADLASDEAAKDTGSTPRQPSAAVPAGSGGGGASKKPKGKRPQPVARWSPGEEWTPIEAHMLRQLTRALARLRRRAVSCWISRRYTQFHAPFVAQLRLLMAGLVQMQLERYVSRLPSVPPPRSSCAVARHTSSADGGSTPTAPASSSDGASWWAEQVTQHAEQCAQAAELLNRVLLPTRASRAVCIAVAMLRRAVCADVPFLFAESKTSAGDEAESVGELRRTTPSAAAAAVSAAAAPISIFARIDPAVYLTEAVATVLRGLQPQIFRLATELLGAIAATRQGYWDARRDLAVLQPAAIRTGRGVARGSSGQLTPSLFIENSAEGTEATRGRLRAEQRAAAGDIRRWRAKLDACVGAEAEVRRAITDAEVVELAAYLPQLIFLPHAKHVVEAAQKIMEERASAAHATHVAQQQQPALDKTTSAALSARRAVQSACAVFAFDEVATPTRAPSVTSDASEEMPLDVLMHAFQYLICTLLISRPDVAAQLCLLANDLTDGRYAAQLLRVAVAVQQNISTVDAHLLTAYAEACRDAPRGLMRMAAARECWLRYTHSSAYAKYIQRPLHGPDGDDAASHGESLRVGDVLTQYQRAAVGLKETRELALLGVCLAEMGDVHHLHHHLGEAERCWSDAADALLEVPSCLQCWRTARFAILDREDGVARLLLAVVPLSALGMFCYNDFQSKAVGVCRLVAAVLRTYLCASRLSLRVPTRLAELAAFTFHRVEPLVFPDDTLRLRMADVVHGLFFTSHTLLNYHYDVDAAIVAAVAEYLAMHELQHVQMTAEARLLRARALMAGGNLHHAMRFLYRLCRGADMPAASFELLALGPCWPVAARTGPAAVSKDGKQNKTRSTSRDSAAAAGGSYEAAEEDWRWCYRNEEPPSSSHNAAAVLIFLARCLPLANFATGDAGGTQLSSPMLPAALRGSYGTQLSSRVLLAVAELLTTLACSGGGAYVWTVHTAAVEAESARRPGSNGQRAGVTALRSASAQRRSYALPAGPTASTEALRAAVQLLDALTKATAAEAAAGDAGAAAVDSSVASAAALLGMRCALIQGDNSKVIRSARAELEAYNSQSTRAASPFKAGATESGDGERAAPGCLTARLERMPSFLVTPNHVYWCHVLLLLVRAYFQSRAYASLHTAAQVALALCDQVGDPYTAQRFTSYRAAALACAGQVAEARAMLAARRDVTSKLAAGRGGYDDAQDAEVLLDLVYMQSAPERSADAREQEHEGRVTAAVEALTAYAQACGLAPWRYEQNTQRWAVPADVPRLTVTDNGVAVHLHDGMNRLARRRLRFGWYHPAQATADAEVSSAIALLLQAVDGLSEQYDTKAYPAPRLESQLLLARARLHALPRSTLQDARVAAWRVGADFCHANSITALPHDELRDISSSLFAVIEGEVHDGTHEYLHLRTALLELAVILATFGGPSAAPAAAACTILAALVEAMQRGTASGAMCYRDYNSDEFTAMDLASLAKLLPPSVMAALEAQLGEPLTAQDGSECLTAKTSRDGSPPPRRSAGSRPSSSAYVRPGSGQDENSREVRVADLVRAYADLRSQRLIATVASAAEGLDHASGLRLLCRQLQKHTTPASCVHLCYSAAVRSAVTGQLNPQRGGLSSSGSKGGGGAAAAAAISRRAGGAMSAGKTMTDASPQQPLDNTALWEALVPPVVLSAVPRDLVTAAGPAALAAPSVNSVVVACFTSALRMPLPLHTPSGNSSEQHCRGARSRLQARSAEADASALTTLVVAVSPYNDCESDTAPSLATIADRRKLLIRRAAAAAPPDRHSSTIGARASSALRRRSLDAVGDTDGVSVTTDAAMTERLRELEQRRADGAPSGWACACFTLPSAVVAELHRHAQDALRCLDRVATTRTCESEKETLDKAEGEETTVVTPARGAATSLAASSMTSPISVNAPASGKRRLAQVLESATGALLKRSPAGSASTGASAPRHAGAPRKSNVTSPPPTRAHSGSLAGISGGSAAVHGTDPLATCGVRRCDLAAEQQQQRAAEASAAAAEAQRQLDEAKSELLIGFLEAVVRQHVAQAQVDEAYMKSCVASLLPRCTLDKEVVQFMERWLAGEGRVEMGSATALFKVHLHEWMRRLVHFTQVEQFRDSAVQHTA